MPSTCASVPGRKTDVNDSQWLASLLRQGRLRASFIPPKAIRDVRDIVRYRKSLVYQRTESKSIVFRRC